ncbi:MAG: T9SS type A sorting domain-containing protein [Bacteroidia bacterium]|nr:T9SS type A sorting domain-containing protein [Bacteroidia bacterium]
MKYLQINLCVLITIFETFCGSFCNNIHASEANLTYLQHDWFIIEADNLTFYVDVLMDPGSSVPSPDVIFITHDHGDHFNSTVVIDLANSSGAYIVGPQPVMSTLTGSLPDTQLITYAPSIGAKITGDLLGVSITIYGSYDGTSQNSYRFEFPSGIIIYHNGDMPGEQFETFVSSGCTELLNMNIAMLDEWAYTMGIFYANYNPDVMIKMHLWDSPCIVYTNYPASFNLSTGNTYTYTYITNVDENPDLKNEINVFPNPSNSITTIQFSNPESENHTLIIYNAKGQAVRKIEHIRNKVVKIENKNLESGAYFFQLLNKNDITAKGRFIKE